MKKVLSLLCVLALAISANAAPIKRVARMASQPIQKAVQSDYQFTNPVNFVALNQESGTGSFVIYMYDTNGTLIGAADINTGSDNSIAGIYTVGTDGGQQYNSYLFVNGQQYPVKYGRLSLSYRGQSVATGEDMYDLVASGWEVQSGSQYASYAFSGTVSGLAAWKTYYNNCQNARTDCDKARITMNEEAPKAAAEISCFAPNITIDTQHMSGDNAYFSVDGIGYATDNNAYELFVILYGNKLEGAYSKDDVATYENQSLAAGLYKSATPDDENSWKEIELASVYGSITRQNGNAYRIDLYAVDKSNNVYHFIMYYNYTANETMMYDTDADFHAAFGLNEVTPLSTTGYMGDYNGLKYFIVEAQNATQSAQLVFFSNRVDETITIPAGRYTISAKESVGVLQAGEIMIEGEKAYPNPSFAYTNEADEAYYRFITSGTAEVQNANGAPYIVVNGVNTFYRTVEVTIGVPPVTGIEEVNMEEVNDGQKMMIDGQLYIKRGDNLYNAQGKLVK